VTSPLYSQLRASADIKPAAWKGGWIWSNGGGWSASVFIHHKPLKLKQACMVRSQHQTVICCDRHFWAQASLHGEKSALNCNLLWQTFLSSNKPAWWEVNTKLQFVVTDILNSSKPIWWAVRTKYNLVWQTCHALVQQETEALYLNTSLALRHPILLSPSVILYNTWVRRPASGFISLLSAGNVV
jgi:hypothetical protein